MELNKEEHAIRDTLSQIETPDYDIEGAVRQAMAAKPLAHRAHPLPRAALVAAALATLLVVGAAAVGISGLWERFFPNPVPQNAVTTIGVSQTGGDYTLTLEDAMVDDNGVILLLTLSRADGNDIDPNASLSSRSMDVELWAHGERFSAGGGLDDSILSADGKSIQFCYEVRDNRDAQFGTVGLTGKTLTLKADGVAIPIYSSEAFGYRPEETTDLSPLAGMALPDFSDIKQLDHGEHDDVIYTAINNLGINLALPMDDAFPLCSVRGAADTNQGLAIALTDRRQSSGNKVCTGLIDPVLIDTRTGTRYSMYEGNGFSGTDGDPFMLYTFRDCPLTTDDLPYLRLEVSYELDEILSEAPFSLTFTPDSGSARILPLNQSVGVADAQLQVNELRLSALGLSLHFTTDMDTVFDAIYPNKLAPTVALKNGSVIQTVWRGGSGGGNGCTVSFQARDTDENRIFLDTSQVASVTLNGVTLWSAGDYILNVEDSTADDDGVILLLSLRRADGGLVDPDARLRSNTISCDLFADGKSIGGGFQPSVLSEDGKTLYLCMESGTDGGFESIAGKKLTFKTGGVGIPLLAPEAFPDREMTVALSSPLPLSKEFPGFRYVEANTTDEGFTVTTTRSRDVYGEYTAIGASPATLTDSRDGKEYRSTQGQYVALPDGTPAYRAIYPGCPLTDADIPYIKATYGYTMDRVLSDAPMAFSFTLSNGSARLIPMDQTVTVSGQEILLTELRFSSISLSLNMSSGADACNALMKNGAGPVLHMRDGTALATSFRGSGSNPDGPSSISFTFVDQKGGRNFPDISQLISISLGSTIIWQTP